MMGKRCALGLFCFAVFIPFDPAFAQIEAVTEKDKPRIRKSSTSRPARPFPWKTNIVTTVFWIGEQPGGNNLVPNRTSAWDKQWTKNYGGFDDPNPAHRRNYVPIKFTPQQNPFYCALPYNDKARTGHRSEAPRVVPWFQEAYRGPAVSTCKDRWVAIRKGNRIAYAQWEDAGPFRTDHWQYVFGNERPKPNLNKGAGLDVSPAVRDYLGLKAARHRIMYTQATRTAITTPANRLAERIPSATAGFSDRRISFVGQPEQPGARGRSKRR